MLAGRGARGPNDPKRWGWGHRVSRAAGGPAEQSQCLLCSWGQIRAMEGTARLGTGTAAAAGSPRAGRRGCGASGDSHQWLFVLLLLLRSAFLEAWPGVGAMVLGPSEAEPPPLALSLPAGGALSFGKSPLPPSVSPEVVSYCLGIPWDSGTDPIGEPGDGCSVPSGNVLPWVSPCLHPELRPHAMVGHHDAPLLQHPPVPWLLQLGGSFPGTGALVAPTSTLGAFGVGVAPADAAFPA